MPERYSPSCLHAYKNCPRQFKFAYIDLIETEEENIEAFIGSRVHEVMQKLYADLKTGKTNTLDELLEHYDAICRREWHSKVNVVKKKYTAKDYKDFGKRCIVNYYGKYAPFNDGETLGLEHRLEFFVDTEKKHKISGYIDRIVKTGEGLYEVHDYKTSTRMPSDAEIEADFQLALYQMGVQDMYADSRRVDLVWHYLSFNAEIRKNITPTALDLIRVAVVKRIEEIERDTEFLPKESFLCRWCNFAKLCDADGFI